MKSYLITGGAGFIGGHFIKYLKENEPDARIINLDKLTYAANPVWTNEFNNMKNYRFVHGSICDYDLVRNIFEEEKPSILINFASESHVDNSIESSESFIQTNVVGTEVLLRVCNEYGIENFIQISTDEVYGHRRGDELFKETDPLLPTNPYSASKAAAELLAMSYYKTHKLPVIITRSSNNFGEYQNEEKLIPKIYKYLKEGKKTPIYGDGLQCREWIYVKDNCSAIYKVIRGGTVGEIYNIGSGNEIQNIDLVSHIVQKVKKIPKELVNEHIEFVEDRKAHDIRYGVCINKIEELNWNPSVDILNWIETKDIL
jgi:dTDP-glucose 4,6-dehydratase